MSGASDPARYLAGGSPRAVLVPARIGRFIDRQLGATRSQLRGADSELDAVLAALHMAGLEFVETSTAARAAVDGSNRLPQLDDPPMLTRGTRRPPLDSLAVAELLGCSPRNVRDLAQRGRLLGERVGGQWFFESEIVEGFLAGRATD